MMKILKSTLIHSALISIITLLSSPAALAMTITQTFDQLPFQPIDGLSHQQVTFAFQLNGVDSDDAKYGSFGPVMTEFVSDPSVVGDSRGVLSFEFDIPTVEYAFATVLSQTAGLSPGFVVTTFDEMMNELSATPVDTRMSAIALGFSDAQFTYSGPAAKRVVVDFADAVGSFAFDNLSYVVPEPNFVGLAPLVLLIFVRRVRFGANDVRS